MSSQFYALFCRILSQRTFTHFFTVIWKNPLHNFIKRGKGSRAVYKFYKKKMHFWCRRASLNRIVGGKPFRPIVFFCDADNHLNWPYYLTKASRMNLVPSWNKSSSNLREIGLAARQSTILSADYSLLPPPPWIK